MIFLERMLIPIVTGSTWKVASSIFILMTVSGESALLEYFELLNSVFIDGSVSSKMERTLILLLIKG